jgi:hypothetical protein
MNTLYGENRFYRHVASHWIEMQQALIAMYVAFFSHRSYHYGCTPLASLT